ncbi:MAG: methyl-accepting chemotaxis protein [Oscillospiraceae bacterium]|nr:methyl-accepting chemotaxis protein [Oscillospiraceae bacterium]
MKNLKVSGKLLVGFGAVIILTVILSVVAIYSASTIDSGYTQLLEYNVERTSLLQKIDGQFWMARRALSHMGVFSGLEGAESNINAQMDVIDQTLADIHVNLDKYIALVREDKEFTDAEKDARISLANSISTSMKQWHDEVVVPVKEANLAERRQDVIDISVRVAPISNGLFGSVSDLLAMADETTNNVSKMADNMQKILIVISAVVVIVSVAFALLIPRGIVNPLIMLSAFMNKAGTTGDITLSQHDAEIIGAHAESKDEIGQTISSSATFVRHINNVADQLEAVAAGDLTTKVEVLSDSDVIGRALVHMIDNLNNMFDEINIATGQVSNGSKQVADGAQMLAQGSTQQAASIQELSSSISEIAGKTKQNAVTADKSAKLSFTIKENAEKGSRQMDDMTTAVKEINDASQSISKIIKTIDDIAFQTNILALNAAVEAARAGQHGKGFAVVAEEVRNLASKSAEAAKDTGNMIQNSMDKAELGARIAGETAESLKEIVIGINESSQLISEIASSSEQQSQGIDQINVGIDQVAQVVQQNSATAQESAAASEEMSSQSDMLQRLISQFKLRSGGSGYASLPPASRSSHSSHSGASIHAAEYTPASGGDFGKY